LAPRSVDLIVGIKRPEIAEKRDEIDRLLRAPNMHYVRKNIWIPAVMARAKRLGGIASYFTLTTADLIDVKILAQAGILEKNERGYPGVGFCEETDAEFARIIRGLSWCGKSYKGTFEQMVFDDDFADTFEFDSVNLDFVLAPFPGVEAPLASTWEAVRHLLKVQRDHGKDFDLLVTFKCKPADSDEEALDRIADLLKSNLDQHRGEAEFQAAVGHLDPKLLLDQDYVKFLSLGIPKLIIADALELGYFASPVEIYRFAPETNDGDIVKFLFDFEIPDSSSRPVGQDPASFQDYDMAVPALFTVGIGDIDEILASSANLTEEIELDVAQLGDFRMVPNEQGG